MARVARAGPVEAESLPWHALTAEDAVRRLDSDAERGLSGAEARLRLRRYGRNEMPRPARASMLRLVLDQFTDFLVLVLLLAIVVSLVAGEWVDAGAISAILLLNAALGFVQEYRAERALEALERLSAPLARVVRDGDLRVIQASAVVPGDIMRVSAGDIVPADGRLISGDVLQAQESALTGESVPVEKSPPAVEAQATLGDRLNMMYAATVVTRGLGRAVVVETGAGTEAGRLATLVRQSGRRPTPLQRRLGETGRRLIVAALSLAALLFVIGIIRGQDTGEMFLTGIALAVAAVPEGLPAAVTIVLAFGVQRMVRRHALVRRLESVETLGTTTVICTDKTGTLTQNRLTAREMLLEGERITIAVDGRDGAGGLFQAADQDRIASSLRWALTVAALCHDSSLGEIRVRGETIGDPVELALLTLAARAGFSQERLRKEYRLVRVLPFESDRKMMSALYLAADGRYIALAKGAPETIASRSAVMIRAGREDEMTAGDRRKIEEGAAEMASRGLRVLGMAYREIASPELTREAESGLVFAGLIGLADPLRPEARDAVEASRRARDSAGGRQGKRGHRA